MLAATVRSFSNSNILWSKSRMIVSANPSHVCSELLPARNPRGITCIQADGLLLLVCTVHLTYESWLARNQAVGLSLRVPAKALCLLWKSSVSCLSCSSSSGSADLACFFLLHPVGKRTIWPTETWNCTRGTLWCPSKTISDIREWPIGRQACRRKQ